MTTPSKDELAERLRKARPKKPKPKTAKKAKSKPAADVAPQDRQDQPPPTTPSGPWSNMPPIMRVLLEHAAKRDNGYFTLPPLDPSPISYAASCRHQYADLGELGIGLHELRQAGHGPRSPSSWRPSGPARQSPRRAALYGLDPCGQLGRWARRPARSAALAVPSHPDDLVSIGIVLAHALVIVHSGS